MNKNQELKKIIEDYKNFDGDIFQKIVDYYIKIYYLDYDILDGGLELSGDEDEELEAIWSIFEWINHGNGKLLVRLNNLLEENEKDKDIIKLEDLMKELQSKKVITVKEFTKIYGYASDWQKNRRSRIRDRLPYVQTVDGGKITYNVNDVEVWFENNNIRF